MASSKNQTGISLDLNKEPEADDDAKHEDDVASESAERSEDKDANQEDESSLPTNRNRAENETETEIMATGKNGTRMLLDLNKEPETDDDAKHEDDVASEPAISEDKDADESSLPINRNRAANENETKTEIMASATRILLDEDDDHEEADEKYDVNQEEEEEEAELDEDDDHEEVDGDYDLNQEDEDVDDEEADEDYDLNQEEEDDHEESDEDYDVNQDEEEEGKEHLKRRKASAVAREQSKKMKMETKDDSEQTLSILSRWKAPEIPPENIVHHSLVEKCSRPIRKQLAKNDIRQRRLRLSKLQMDKKFQRFLQLLAGTTVSRGKKGSTVSVYGPDGRVHEMQMSPDLTKGWTEFVRYYELQAHCDFVTVWMFMHRATQKICVAIDTERFAITKPVSTRILKAAFEDDSDSG